VNLDYFFAALAFWSGGRALSRAMNGTGRSRRLGDADDRSGGGYQSRMYDVKNIDERVSHIVGLVQRGRTDPKVVMLARRVVSQKCGDDWCIPERDYSGEVRAIFAEVRKRVRYVRDAWGVDQFTGARRSLYESHGGDCDDYVVTLGSMLQAIGYPVKLRVIQTVGSPDWSHIYLVVGLPPEQPSKWASLDASVNEPPGWEAPASQIRKKRDYWVP